MVVWVIILRVLSDFGGCVITRIFADLFLNVVILLAFCVFCDTFENIFG